ncbi:MAG: hypothetical protein KY446_07035 [Proteobacteria bacterium]|nr:hypothetical protein [Pseudomonadota bacterium]
MSDQDSAPEPARTENKLPENPVRVSADQNPADARTDERATDLQGEGAGQTSSPTTGAAAVGGSFAPAYDDVDPFLGAGAHVVSGQARGPVVDDDMRDSPGLNLDVGRDPHGGGKDVGVVRSHEPGDAGQGSDDLRTYEDQGPKGTR